MKAAFEMKLAAARCGVQLQMTEPEIDNIGHDFIASNGFTQIFLQNKSTLDSAKVTSWELHAMFLQASFQDRDLAPVISGIPVGGIEGAFGGFLLHEISEKAACQGALQVSYRYFDIIYANAVRTGLWKSESFAPKQAEQLLLQIAKANRGDRIKIPKAYMLPITSPNAILSFRLHIPGPSNWMSLGSQNNSWDDTEGMEVGERILIDYWRKEIGYWTH